MKSEKELRDLRSKCKEYEKLYSIAEDDESRDFYWQKIEEISKIIVHEYMFD